MANNAAGCPHQPRRVLVLDLDETLVHSVGEDMMRHDSTSDPHGSEVAVLLRPGVQLFLRRMASVYDELVIFTAATREYADAVIEQTLDASGTLLGRRFYRESCDPFQDMAKDLRKLGVPLDSVVILDNSPAAYAMQPLNGVPIPSFTGDPSDRALNEVTPLLLEIARERDMDVRQVIGLHAPSMRPSSSWSSLTSSSSSSSPSRHPFRGAARAALSTFQTHGGSAGSICAPRQRRAVRVCV